MPRSTDESGIYRSISEGLFGITNSGDIIPLKWDRENKVKELPEDSYRLVAARTRTHRGLPDDREEFVERD